MQTIVHLSDLHFGYADNERIPNLIKQIKLLDPDLVIISGDLTERATEKQYKEAQAFITALEIPFFVIPGNHDIPLYNVYKRLTAPFAKYHKFIAKNTSPHYQDTNLCIVGINSVRRYSFSSGGITKRQIDNAEKLLQGATVGSIKIVVSHHPFDMPDINGYRKYTHRLMTSSKKALERLSANGVDLFLSGHLHIPFAGDNTVHHKIKGWGGILVHAGTASSMRTRGAPVSFNIIRITHPTLTVEHYDGSSDDFSYKRTSEFKFKKDKSGWKKA